MLKKKLIYVINHTSLYDYRVKDVVGNTFPSNRHSINHSILTISIGKGLLRNDGSGSAFLVIIISFE